MNDLNPLGDIPERVQSLRARYAKRDQKVFQIQAIRQGRVREVAPDLFSDEYPESLVANTIDEAAKSYAAKLGMLPAINCAPENPSEAAKKRADKRTKINNNYIAASNMPVQILTGSDNLGTFGLIVGCVYPDFEAKMPRLKIESAVGTYPVWDGAGRTVEVARVYRRDWFSICADYPNIRVLRDTYDIVGPDGLVEVVKYVNKDQTIVYLPGMGNAVLENIPNLLGECYYEVAKLPWLDEATIKGNYDDIAWVQIARHQLQMDIMSGVDQAVNAAVIVPPDVADVPYGPGAVIRTQNPQGIGRMQLNMPPQAFTAVDQLRHEMFGVANPESMSGQTDASVITGRGMQELGAGFDGQIAVGQTVIKYFLQRLLSKQMKLDERVFGNVKKTARGFAMGTPFEIEYQAKKDIDGHYDVDVEYGYAAGLDANRSLILLLQLNGVGALSKDTMMRNSPIPINVTEETQQIDIEHLRDSAVQALAGYVQSIPQLAANGMDPSQPVMAIAQVVKARRNGRQVEEAIADIFAPPEPPPEQATGSPQGPPGAPGFEDSGLPSGLQSNLATEGPNGRPDLAQLFAGIGSGGQPQLSAGVSRMNPVAGT